jgi:hypothetical protein
MPKVQEEIVRMDTTDNFAQDLNKIFQDPPDACFCAMGVGNPKLVMAEHLEQVDCTLPSMFAKSLAKAGTKHACLLSAVGSDIDSKPSKIVSILGGSAWAVYPRVKVKLNRTLQRNHFRL